MNSDMRRSLATEVVLAFVLLTRLPMPGLSDDTFQQGARAVWAYPLVGAVLGALALVCGQLFTALGLPSSVAAGAMIAVLALCSGAMHEDGLADTADGFWGAATAEKRLDIMKDSQIGTYGVMTLLLITGLRWTALAALLPVSPAAIVAAACLSRSAMPLLMYGLPAARTAGLANSVGRPRFAVAASGLALALVLAGVAIGPVAFVALLVVLAAAAGMAALAKWKIGGQTGDVLGATQQITEMLVLLTCTIALV